MKTRKLRKLFTKLQAVKQDISDVTEEYNRDRRDLVSHLHPLYFFCLPLFEMSSLG